jgi:hypothetical protein
MGEITVHSWNELQDALYADSWQPQLQRFRSPFVFRGVQSASASLETT